MAESFPLDLHGISSANPATSAAAITKSDATEFEATRGIYVGGSGDIKVDMIGSGTAVIFVGVPVGVLPIQVTRVYSADTTATSMVALR